MNILFQGDSITDAGRNRAVEGPNRSLGGGYVYLLASRLSCENPNYKIYNRGICGNRIGDMYSRWHEDALNIDFDMLSILNGINDVGFLFRLQRGASAEEFEFMYDHIIDITLKAKPQTKLVLMEPFVIKHNIMETDPQTKDPGDMYLAWDKWSNEIALRGQAVKRIAAKYGAVFVPLFEEFTQLTKENGSALYTTDGVHPSPAGNEIIARRWLECCKDILE